MGVENFSDELLEINGRAHRSPEIERTYRFARSIGFPQINIDLIAGMMGETEENWRECIQKTLAMEPDSVTIYQMEIPFNTTIYKNMKAEGKQIAPVADWETKRRWVKEAFAALEESGYSVGSAYTAVRDASKTRFVYRDRLWRGADLLALGVASFSHIGGTHFQNEKDFDRYNESIEAGQLPIHRALRLSSEERLIRELVLQMKLGYLNPSYFEQKFGVDIHTRFREPFESMRQQGWMSVSQDEIRLTREALLQVDHLLWSFFLPEHKTDRYT